MASASRIFEQMEMPILKRMDTVLFWFLICYLLRNCFLNIYCIGEMKNKSVVCSHIEKERKKKHFYAAIAIVSVLMLFKSGFVCVCG